MLSLGDRACDASPVFEGALPVPFDTRSGASAELGDRSRCLRAPGASASTTYGVFALPQGGTPSTVTITSLADGGTVVSPRVTFYDAAGAVLRSLDPEGFRADVRGLQAGARLRGTERWAVVEADRAMLGKPVTLLLGDADQGRVQVAAAVFIYVPPPPIPDIVRERTAVYALNGKVQVTMTPVPTVP